MHRLTAGITLVLGFGLLFGMQLHPQSVNAQNVSNRVAAVKEPHFSHEAELLKAGLPQFQTDPIYTSTPGPDGAIVHEVQAGQTLVGIAEVYGVSLEDLLAANGFTAQTVIYPGDKITMRLGATPTVTAVASHTPVPTRTATATQRPATATITPRPLTPTPSITPTPTSAPWLRLPEVDLDRRTLGIAIIVISITGLVLVGLLSFRGNG